jgi:hypothetical protein
MLRKDQKDVHDIRDIRGSAGMDDAPAGVCSPGERQEFQGIPI